MSDREVEKIIAVMAGDKPLTPVQVIGIQAATEGNPLFVEHSYLYMADSETMLGGGARVQASFTEEDLELAQSVRGLIGRRLERLSEPAQRMLVAAAVIGRDFDIPLLEAFGELSGHELRDAIDEATRGRFLTAAGPERYRFSHDLVRQRVLAVLPLPRLQAYHLHIADTLERVYGKSATEKAGEIAHHLYQAGTSADSVKTSGFLTQAAKNALAIGAFEEVLRLVERALQLLPGDKTRDRAEALALRGQAYWGLSRNNDAKAAWTGALGRYEELGDAKSAAGIHAQLHEIGADGIAPERPKAHEPAAPKEVEV
jgi:predicted ATPase